MDYFSVNFGIDSLGNFPKDCRQIHGTHTKS